MSNEFCSIPCDFLTALGYAGISKCGYDLILYLLRSTYKRWIRHKTLDSCGLDWVDYKQRKLNRECWGINNTKEIKYAIDNLLSKEIIVIDSRISKIRINYNYETWNI